MCERPEREGNAHPHGDTGAVEPTPKGLVRPAWPFWLEIIHSTQCLVSEGSDVAFLASNHTVGVSCRGLAPENL